MEFGAKQCYIPIMSRTRIHTGIYCIENRLNGKKYIGQAYNVERRLYEHEYHLKRGTDKSTALQNAINKYGFDNFEFYILEACEPGQMNDREIYYISKYNTNDRHHGYNVSAGGGQGLVGYKWPAEFGRKISAAKKGWVMSEEQKKKISNWHRGKSVSEETRRKISAEISGEKHYMFGKKHTEETKQKMSRSHSGEKAYQLGKKSSNSTSQYYGVFRLTQKGHIYWAAKVNHNGSRTYVGMSKDEIEAARMYDAYVIENNLPNPLNFPEE